jgi:hypothetical protein
LIWLVNELSETDPSTAQELRLLLNEKERSPKCVAAGVYEGDWRARFAQGVHASSELVLFSFDPYMFNRHPVKDPKLGNMYASDLERLTTVVRGMPHVIVQLSTYSANCANSQRDVIAAVTSLLNGCGLELLATVSANGQMMSLVLARGIGLSDSIRSLASRYDSWLARAEQKLGPVGMLDAEASRR